MRKRYKSNGPIAAAMVLGEDILEDAALRGMELSDEEYQDIEEFLLEYDPLYVAGVSAVDKALDMIVEKRIARACGVEADDERSDETEQVQSVEAGSSPF